MLCELQLVFVLETGLQVVAPICLLLLNELAQSHANHPWYVVLVLCEKILQTLRRKLQRCLLLGVNESIAFYYGCVNATVVQLGDEVLGGLYVV